MFYVSISRSVLNKVMDRAKSTDKEIIGILVGNIEEHTILIEDAVSGEHESDNTRASLPPKTIAEVTDKILKGEISGTIVGWYHSHPGFGIFMSQTDVNTQNTLQQFSSKVTALIVDPDDEDFGFFTILDPEGTIQLEKNQVHVYDEEEEMIPERFSSPPEIPKKAKKKARRTKVVMPPPFEPTSSSTKLIAVGLAVAIVCVAIGSFILWRYIQEEPKFSSVDNVSLVGEREKNQQNVSIFDNLIEIHANVTVVEGKITGEGLSFYLSLRGGGWVFLGNDSAPVNDTYTLIFSTNRYSEGIHQIKVNFSDSLDHTWEKDSEPFIIDNTPDPPSVRFLDPRNRQTIDGNITIYAEVKDNENNIYSVGFYYENSTINWSKIGETRYVGELVYVTNWDTNQFRNGTYTIKVEAEDRNLYMDEEMITVNILHNR
ncbi:MAG: Mov34/MPN/PAD-1 family protein [Thermoplasmata archaeon]|nr:MAG: Mov34/MPN/PAD-1 family protein [Thermoplasmata archaeon]